MTHEQHRDMVRASLVASECREAGRESVRARCICGCGRRGVQKHHAVYEQEVKRLGGAVDDPRNLVRVWHECHAAHHARVQAFALRRLPASVFAFAEELMGAGPAYEYLRRRYAGEDERLDGLLRRYEAENPMHDDGN
jgi:hypothetical protein